MSNVVIAVRGDAQAKSRCASLLDAAERQKLVSLMLADMLAALSRKIERVWVVTRSHGIMDQVHGAGAHAILQTDTGLNEAFAAAHAAMAQRAPETLVAFLPGDLPLIDCAELEMAFAEAERSRPLLIPADADGGTNGVILRAGDDFRFRFGDASLTRHIAAAREFGYSPRVLRLPSLGFDVDRPDDFLALDQTDPHTETVRFFRQWKKRQSAAAQKTPVTIGMHG